jgi:hypothetical protein
LPAVVFDKQHLTATTTVGGCRLGPARRIEKRFINPADQRVIVYDVAPAAFCRLPGQICAPLPVE